MVASCENITAVFKSADPRLLKDPSIRQFVVGFGVYRNVICTIYPERRQEFDPYLALISDLNLKYSKNIFYQYHKAFSTKGHRSIQYPAKLVKIMVDGESFQIPSPLLNLPQPQPAWPDTHGHQVVPIHPSQ